MFRVRDSHSLWWVSHSLPLHVCVHIPVRTPDVLLRLVWPLPRSLATTYGISFDFSSSPYLDVSVREVPSIRLFDSAYRSWFFIMKVSPFRNPRIEAYLQLPVAYRSLSRLSSAPDAKAFTLCSCSLELFLWEVLPSHGPFDSLKNCWVTFYSFLRV